MHTEEKLSPQKSSSNNFRWNFYRIGGLDQVTLRTTQELQHLEELDPKLWVALSCPTRGLHFHERTLELIDTDKDTRIHIRDVLAAVSWLNLRLKDPITMTEGHSDLPLEYICDTTEEGKLLLAAAQRLLHTLDKKDALTLAEEDVAGVRAATVQTLLNGDGILPPHESMDEDLQALVNDILDTIGTTEDGDTKSRGVEDADGSFGINREMLQTFMEQAREYQDWITRETAFKADFKLGENTAAGYALFQELEAKIDDYFTRCRLVEFDDRAASAVNAPEAILEKLGAAHLAPEDVNMAELPLARIAASRPLPLGKGLNPAWVPTFQTFANTVVSPLLGDRQELGEEDWAIIRQTFSGYVELMSTRPLPLQQLPPARIEEILASNMQGRLENLFEQDEAIAPEVLGMEDVERLVLYHKYLYRFLMNFVSFFDFYAPDKDSIFQNGTLYMDGRSCSLCIRVEDVEKHAAAAAASYLCLLYCKCTRQETGEIMNIAAAMTAGDAEFLSPGRNGVFVDCHGDVWDASLVKLVENPISIRTAMFAPYRRFARMVTEQIEKYTADKDAAVTGNGASLISGLASAPAAPAGAAAPAAPFDITKSVGVLAAVGLALGALGTALATIASSVLSLRWWEMPLLVLGIMLLISGPSMIMAWLKLRKRTLGPVLDASGWAVNTRIPINLSLGARLTDTAVLPHNTARQLRDPLHDANPWTRVLVIVFLLALVGGGFFGWQAWNKAHEPSPQATEAEQDAAAKAAPKAADSTVPEESAPEKPAPDNLATDKPDAEADAKSNEDNSTPEAPASEPAASGSIPPAE